MASTNEQFAQAAQQWDLQTLYTDLASAKGKPLTPIEKLHLRGLLCGHSPAEIAEKLQKSPKGLGVELCNTLYQYVKNLVGKCDEKIENWRNICQWLEEVGYKTNPYSNSSDTDQQLGDCLPLKFVVKKANINVDKNQIIIDINLRIVASSPSDILPLQMLDLDQNNVN